ncbi:MAG: hypothetical protein RIC35_14060 [Marinoscillum sp.]
MTSAIFEILALLTVSCLIGVFFTFRYWKSKYTALSLEKDQLAQDKKSLEAELDKLKSKISDLEKQLTTAQQAQEKAENKKPAKPQKNNEVKTLKEEIVILNEYMAEKEREIEELSKELAHKNISYYKQIDGKRYKAITLKMADEAIEGQGDGRISMEDAEKIFATISDGKAYTQVEKHTMRYLRDHYKWTEGADDLFRTKVRSWAAKGHELN